MKTIAGHFERFAHGKETKELANQGIADHLLAFAWQFSADHEGMQIPTVRSQPLCI